ncbi:MAG: universal stress protein [Deltaproteobacteria bacterium]
MTELGTFSETLFLSSELPLFLVNPRGPIPQSYQEIFFPTDLSAVSLGSLEPIEELAQHLHAHVTIFHKVLPFTKDIVEFPYTSDVRSHFLEQLQITAQDKLDSIISRLKEKGVQSTLVLDRIEAEYVSKAITSRAERNKECLIAMVSRTDLGPQTLPGSITRQVLRSTVVPVWVLHPNRKQEIVTPNLNRI